LSSASRRGFLRQSASLAGKVATAAAVSLPILGAMSEKARALGWTGWIDQGTKCFLRGTLVRTPGGEIPVEELTIGTLVDTLRGPLPVKWIGRQRFEKTNPRWHRTVAPIRVAQFALSDQYPHRDLYLSPQHSLFMEGLLIPVERLVNGKSIALAAVDHLETIDYLHIELETHEIVFAEGAPAETLLITNDREQFPNFVEYERLYGADERPPMEPFAPVLTYKGGVSPVARDSLQRVRARIAARAELIDT